MVILTRTVRFCINPPQPGVDPASPVSGSNGYASIPAMRGLGRHYELDVRCRGMAHPLTGYFINIKEIDAAVRQHALGIIAAACARADAGDTSVRESAVLASVLTAVNTGLANRVASILWRLSPFYSVEMHMNQPAVAVLRQRFEIAAAHRLHIPSLSADENRRIFGKCNNPSGHGHNYVIEPAVAVPASAQIPFTLADLEHAVNDAIIKPFDHTHLNIDTPEFADGRGVNPSVENISRAFFELLAPRIASANGDAVLQHVTVWETEKTSSTYPG